MRIRPRTSFCVLASGLLLLGACAAGDPGPDPASRRGPVDPGQVVAVVNGRPVQWSEIRAPLAETAGRTVLDEVILDRLLEQEAERRSIEVTQAMRAAELDRFLLALARETGIDPGQGARLIDRLRTNRGLGPDRFERLLHRNAIMRALTAPEVEVTEDEIALAHAIRHGPRRVVRVHVRATEREAASDRESIIDAGGGSEAFGSVAVARSEDPSAPRGGLLEALSLSDPAFPQAVRTAIGLLEPGEITPVLALDRGYAIVRLEREISASGVAVAESRATIEAELRVRKERVAADVLARELLNSAEITVFDPALRWSRTGSR